jgi:hypothetical protein
VRKFHADPKVEQVVGLFLVTPEKRSGQGALPGAVRKAQGGKPGKSNAVMDVFSGVIAQRRGT